ncbi:MAG: hypothetical protein MUF36_05140 [Bacteroidales bacterium]|nr:hypothetical protein [Bacteroidales bacterium]
MSFPIGIYAQENNPKFQEKPKNCVTVSLLGDGSNVSLNYERLLPLNNYLFISGRLGAGYGRQLTLNSDSVAMPIYLAIPAHVTLNAGKGRHYAEIGMGNTLTIGNVQPHYLYYLIFGYKFYPLMRYNFSIRIFGNLLLNNNDNFRDIYFVPFGLSLGYTF